MSLINDALKRAGQAEKLRPIPRPPGPALQPAVRSGAPGGSRSWLLGSAVGVTALLAAWFLWQWFATTPTDGGPGVTLATRPPRGADKTTTTNSPSANDKPAAAAATLGDRASDSAKSALVALTGSAKSAAATLTAAVARQAETPAPEAASKSTNQPNPARAGDQGNATSAAANTIPPAVMAAVAGAAPAPATPALLDPVLPAPPAFPPIRLQGVIYRPTKATAFINGRMMSVGDQLEEAMLVKIDRQSVTFELGKESKVVQLAK